MTPITVTTYAGRLEVAGLSDLTTAQDLDFAIRSSDALVVSDPLSFPWEWFSDSPIRCPIILDVGTCTEDDMVALSPVLTGLTASDRVLGEPTMAATLCQTLGLPNIWSGLDLDIATFAAKAGRSKLADVEEAMIVRRLSKDDDLIIRIIDGDQLRSARSGFATLVQQISDELNRAVVDTVWGIHPEPGTPVERVVLAFRPLAAT